MPTQLASMARHAPTALAACLLSTQRLPDILGCMCKAVHELMACSNVAMQQCNTRGGAQPNVAAIRLRCQARCGSNSTCRQLAAAAAA